MPKSKKKRVKRTIENDKEFCLHPTKGYRRIQIGERHHTANVEHKLKTMFGFDPSTSAK